MKTFSDYSSQLIPHKEFDPNAFVSNDEVPQDLCNFVLTLSLVYNDYKFYTISYNMHVDSKPDSGPCRNSYWGEYIGIELHLLRLHIAFVHELFKVIRENKKILNYPFFKELIRVTPKNGRDAWNNLVKAALNKKPKNLKSNPLFMIRNKVIFHYDVKELFSGYRRGFFSNNKIKENACISAGDKLINSRFYFADLAIQSYLDRKIGIDPEKFISSLSKTMRTVNIALYHICIKFIQRRNFAWKEPKTKE